MAGWPLGRHLRHAHRAFGSVHHDKLLQRGLFPNGENFLQLHFAGDKNNARPRIPQDVGRLFCRKRGIDRDRDRAQQQGSEVCHRPLRPVFAQNGNPVAAPDAPSLQPARHGRDPPAKPVRRDRNPLLPHPLQHRAGMLALHDGKKHIVKCAQTHSRKKSGSDLSNECTALPTPRQTSQSLTAPQRHCYDDPAGWSSLVARWAHNPKVGGSNPPPATTPKLHFVNHLKRIPRTANQLQLAPFGSHSSHPPVKTLSLVRD